MIWKATPLAVDIGINNAVCLPPEALNLTLEEAQAIAKAISDFFEELEVTVQKPTLWLFTVPEKWNVKFPPLKQMLNLPLTDCLPEGKDAAKASALLTELQMYLKTLPENVKRAKEGLLQVNTFHLQSQKFFASRLKIF